MIGALIAVPLVAAGLVFLCRASAQRRTLLVMAATVHAVLTGFACASDVSVAPSAWLGLDSLGRLFLATTSAVFLIVSVYVAGYLGREPAGQRNDSMGPGLFSNAPEAIFVACLLAFLSMMSLVTVSQHFGVLWVAVEGTTLASAPLIYFHRHHRSLEATWKYLLICSVGIAVALLGTFFLAVSSAPADGALDLSSVLERAGGMDSSWLRGAFLLMLVGYGTKMGLAPMHTWLPDAHSEAPSAVSALLSAALLNCAWLGILRMQQVLVAAGQGEFGADLLVVFGLLSMCFGALFILGQTDFKRLLAYSSVEHMGILALGVGLGGAATAGSMLHMINHSATKALLFLVAGNTLATYGTRSIASVRGVLARHPITGTLWIVGLFAVVGSPPFGTFLSEFLVLRGALDSGVLVTVLYLGALALAFIGLSRSILAMVQSAPPTKVASKPESFFAVAPPILLATIALTLGLYLPPSLRDMIAAAARALGGVGF